MAICECCGNEFDKKEAESYFISECGMFSYDNFKKCLCGKCAVDAIEDCENYVYYEKCEECGKEFDLAEDESRFAEHFPWYNGTRLRDHWDNKILCADCALELLDDLETIE